MAATVARQLVADDVETDDFGSVHRFAKAAVHCHFHGGLEFVERVDLRGGAGVLDAFPAVIARV